MQQKGLMVFHYCSILELEVQKLNGLSSAAENITTCKDKAIKYAKRSKYSNKAVKLTTDCG